MSDPVAAGDARRAAASAQRLAARGYDEDRAGLERALAKGDQAERAEAAFLLGHARDAAAADALRAALEDESARVRVEAALGLARVGDVGTALPVLRREVDGEFFADAPLRAVRALAILGDDSGWGRLREALASPLVSNRMEAVAALPAFAPLRRDEVVSALRAAQEDPDELLRRDAEAALAVL